jgi:pimeloyl-ACP methyl ester carboxylesterase
MKRARERVLLGKWTSADAEQRFRQLEDELAAELVAEPPSPVDVATRLGPTRAYRWAGAGEPVVFLHGAAGTSMMWVDYAAARGGRAMCAVDTIGEVGRSRQERPVEGPDDLAAWLAEVLDGLGLERAHLAGTSYGGFLALNLAARHPERVRSLFLIDPAGVVPVRLARFLAWGTAVFLASLLPARPRRAAGRALRTPFLDDPRVLRLAFYGQRHHRTRLVRPEPLTDDQLRSIDQPTVVIVAGKSEVFRVAELCDRASTLLPDAAVEVVPCAGHAVVSSHVDLLTARLATFQQDLATRDDRT